MQETDPNVARKRISVNGWNMESEAPTLAALLTELAVTDNAVVAEVNGAIVPHNAFAETLLNDGDVIELVRFVGGG